MRGKIEIALVIPLQAGDVVVATGRGPDATKDTAIEVGLIIRIEIMQKSQLPAPPDHPHAHVETLAVLVLRPQRKWPLGMVKDQPSPVFL